MDRKLLDDMTDRLGLFAVLDMLRAYCECKEQVAAEDGNESQQVAWSESAHMIERIYSK